MLVLISCDKIDSMLDTTNYQKTDTSSFPKTEKDAEQLVNSAYYSLRQFFVGSIFQVNVFRNMIASDDLYGAGSTSSKETSADDRLLAPSSDEDNSPWKRYYEGLHRCNFALEAISDMDDALFTSDNKNWYLGQAHFMRAYFLWELAERWETFPLTLSSLVENTPRATVDEVYEAIAADLKDAINLIPAKYGYSKDNNLCGRATKYAAEALMGRVWLFYTGFYKKSDMAGITKQQVTPCGSGERSARNLAVLQRVLQRFRLRHRLRHLGQPREPPLGGQPQQGDDLGRSFLHDRSV